MNLPRSPIARCLVAGLFAVVLLARATPSLRAADDDAKLHAELRQVAAVYENALSSGDLTPLAAWFTPESSGVTVDNQQFKSFAELKAIFDKFRASFPGVVYHIKLQPVPSRIFGDIAVASGTCDESVKTSDGEFTYTSTWTAVLRRVDGQWKLVRSQVTMDPFHNSVVQYFNGRTKLCYGLGALVIGLIAGFVLARMTGPKRMAA